MSRTRINDLSRCILLTHLPVYICSSDTKTRQLHASISSSSPAFHTRHDPHGSFLCDTVRIRTELCGGGDRQGLFELQHLFGSA